MRDPQDVVVYGDSVVDDRDSRESRGERARSPRSVHAFTARDAGAPRRAAPRGVRQRLRRAARPPLSEPCRASVAGAPPALLTEAPLPLAPREQPQSYWLELVAQGEHVAFLRDQRDSRSQYQRWLYPFASGAFEEPAYLFDVEDYSWLGAENLSVDADAGAALTLFTPLAMSPNGAEVERARVELVRYRDLSSAALAEPVRITVPGFPLYVGARRAVTIEPASALGPGGAAPAVLVHQLALDGGLARIVQTLELPSGAVGYRWAGERGYVLLVSDDRCAEPESTLVSVRFDGDRLEEAGRLTLPGTEWQLREVTDAVALLSRGLDGLVQHAVVDAAGAELSLREYQTHHERVPVSAWGDRVWFDVEP